MSSSYLDHNKEVLVWDIANAGNIWLHYPSTPGFACQFQSFPLQPCAVVLGHRSKLNIFVV